MSIEKEIETLISLVEAPDKNDDVIETLIHSLDKLTFQVHEAEFAFDENEYDDAPEINYGELRTVVEKKFPKLGYYHTSDFEEPTEKNGEVSLGDAIDDIVDIVADLKDVKWYFENTSKNNAIWHFVTGFRSHWGGHVRELQTYLYRNYY